MSKPSAKRHIEMKRRYNRAREKWKLNGRLFDVASKAVSDERSERQQSIKQLKEEWKAALSSEI